MSDKSREPLTRERTLAEALAVEVLKGDILAAYALADKLQEEKNNPEGIYRSSLRAYESTSAIDGYELYHRPEFEALCKLLNIPYGLSTVGMTITIKEGHNVTVNHTYQTRIARSV